MNASISAKFGCFILSASAFFYPSLAGANIIDLTYGAGAGSFELGNYIDGGGIPPSFPGWMGVAAGDSSTITGWRIGGPGDGIDWLIEPAFNADTGVHSIDLQHLTESSISTVIPTVIGDSYALSFSAASVVGRSNTGIVSAGSLLNQSFATLLSADFATQQYTPFSFLFTATESSTTIEFTSLAPTAGYGPVIDSVSVVSAQAVPLPPSILLFLSGLGAFFLRLRKKFA